MKKGFSYKNLFLVKDACALLLGIGVCISCICGCSLIDSKGYENFEVNENILVSYNGESNVVDVPQSVQEISHNAFGNSLNSDKITNINLGSKVEKIDISAFSELPSLLSVNVSEENPYYMCYDNFLLAKDGGAIFCFGMLDLDIYSLITASDNVVKSIPFYKDGYKIIFHNAVLHFAEGEPEQIIDSLTIEDGLLTRISVDEYSVTFKSPIGYYGDHAWSLFKTENAMVFTDLISYAVGDTYIFTDDGIYEQHNLDYSVHSDYNAPVVVFSPGKDGKLKYTCRPIKFISFDDGGSELVYCVGMDEVYMEIGTVVFENNEPKYIAESTITFVQQYGKDRVQEMYNGICESSSTISGSGFNSQSETLEEYLKSNSQKYNAFNPSTIHL